ncbi:sensor histidine kinase [Atopomonas sediminilitoris]|uniref:sensor histidine kinase n=1 Tax=Atopomonas sediminilitoris TaxID=2919919 RepID=UPI001F4ECD39|nr:HAMP domain-containing sensor histidine kinase [Atopomonas sediminilitoris]MCJ8169850.1 ATP-binding protein [Atopomonas sediminilitoris]
MRAARPFLYDLPVGHKILAGLLVLLLSTLLIANLAFISAAYWITQESMAPSAMRTLGQVFASPALSAEALASPAAAEQALKRLDGHAPLRGAALYGADGARLGERFWGKPLNVPSNAGQLDDWSDRHVRKSRITQLPLPENQHGHLLLIASSELPSEFFTGTLSASFGIFIVSALLWVILARQLRTLVTKPIRRLEELSRQVTEREDYSLRARISGEDEIGRLGQAFNTMLTRIQAREQELKDARDEACAAEQQAHQLAEDARRGHRKLQLEIQVRSKIEKKLTGFQHYLNSIINSMPSALVAVDEQLFVTQWNQATCALQGLQRDDALNKPLFLVFPNLESFSSTLQDVIQRHKSASIERVSWPYQDENRHFALTFYPLSGASGRGAVIRIDDITTRLNMEELMVQSDKMLSVGGLAAGMAHEINNPLGAMLHNVQNLRRRLSANLPRNQHVADELRLDLDLLERYLEQREIPALLDGIDAAGQRAARIVNHMLKFSRMSDRQLAPCDINALVEQAAEVARTELQLADGGDLRQLPIELSLSNRLPQALGVSTELEQVLLNLISNAAHAIGQRKRQVPSLAGHIHIRTRLRSPWVEILLEDNGIGMPDKVRKRIFEPFFTTKDTGQGTGLGLSVSYFIITNNHNGQMEVQSEMGAGTCFTLRLPVA